MGKLIPQSVSAFYCTFKTLTNRPLVSSQYLHPVIKRNITRLACINAISCSALTINNHKRANNIQASYLTQNFNGECVLTKFQTIVYLFPIICHLKTHLIIAEDFNSTAAKPEG